MLTEKRSMVSQPFGNSLTQSTKLGGARLDLLLGSSENLAKVKVMWGMDERPLKLFIGWVLKDTAY